MVLASSLKPRAWYASSAFTHCGLQLSSTLRTRESEAKEVSHRAVVVEATERESGWAARSGSHDTTGAWWAAARRVGEPPHELSARRARTSSLGSTGSDMCHRLRRGWVGCTPARSVLHPRDTLQGTRRGWTHTCVVPCVSRPAGARRDLRDGPGMPAWTRLQAPFAGAVVAHPAGRRDTACS